MAQKKQGHWWVDMRPDGRDGRRYRKKFETKAEATAFEAYITEQHRQNPDWEPPKKDPRRLSQLAADWYELHGTKLRDGAGRLQILYALADRLGDPPARLLTGADFTRYANARLKGNKAKDEKPISANTINHELSYLKAVYNKLIALDLWPHGNPVDKVSKWKTPDNELTYLTTEQIEYLLYQCTQGKNPDVALCAELALDTGARWGEAETLKLRHVGKGQITFYNTKGGKPRPIPITADLEKRLRAHAKARALPDGRIFGPCYDALYNALKRAEIELPAGQGTHVLRHTFASHFMMNGGNIVTLQRILGHHSITMTQRYAHLAPDHFLEVLRLKPIRTP